MEFDGKKYTASYYVRSGAVTIESSYGTTSTQVGGSPAASMARQLLREILNSAKSKGQL